MTRKLATAFATLVLSIVVAITIVAHCGDTWESADPNFGPTLGPNGCTASSNPTVTTKSVDTTIHWNVGPPLTQTITDQGENKSFNNGLAQSCTRCFPEFETPQWSEPSAGITRWSQLTYKKFISSSNTCETDGSRGAINHHWERNCNVSEEECEAEYNWFWNPIDDGCQEEGPPPCDLEPVICENGQWSFQWCDCIPNVTPILIDVAGDGFDLTNAAGGVTFDLNRIGGKEKLAWTNGTSDDAWLVLDRNNNGSIDEGAELFGDVTAQPDPPAGEKKNGFRALAIYDATANGGSGDGLISGSDSVFSSLRLWQDKNHNGLSEANELHTLPSVNVSAIDLDYQTAKKMDSHGNRFSFRSKITSLRGQKPGRWAWDVYLTVSP